MKKKIIVGKNVMEIEIADTFFRRFRGLMLRAFLHSGSGILLSPCSRIHTCFMRFSIDVLYLNDEYTVLAKETLKPWKLGLRIKGTKKVLEGSSGFAENLEAGTVLMFTEENSAADNQ